MKILLFVCTLWSSMYINPCDGLEISVPILEKVVAHDHKLFRFGCGAEGCGTISIKISGGSGCFFLNVGGRTIETSLDQTTTQISTGDLDFGRRTSFDVDLTTNEECPTFENIRLKVTFNKEMTKTSITELSAEGGSIQRRRSGESFVRIKSGYIASQLHYYFTHFMITCDGDCRNVEISLIEGEGNANVVASEAEPVLPHEKGCFNCFCTSKDPGSRDRCRNAANETKFNPNSNVVYVSLVPDPSFREVEAHIKADNIESVSPPDDFSESVQSKTQDGPLRHLVLHIRGPLKKGEHVHFILSCTSDKCPPSTIEVSANVEFSIRAGKDTYIDPSGNCLECKCNNSSSCRKGFNPASDFFYITMEAGDDYNGYYAYVKVSQTSPITGAQLASKYNRDSYVRIPFGPGSQVPIKCGENTCYLG